MNSNLAVDWWSGLSSEMQDSYVRFYHPNKENDLTINEIIHIWQLEKPKLGLTTFCSCMFPRVSCFTGNCVICNNRIK